MTELDFAPLPARSELRQALREQLGGMAPPLRIVASDLLGAATTIDLLAVDGDGAVVLVLIGDTGQDLELFTRALAHREWARPRLRDWLQLAPDIPIEVDAPIRVLLLCPSFQEETLLAARSRAGSGIELGVVRCVRNGARVAVLVEPVRRSEAEAANPASHESTRPSAFRSGLTDQDLNLSSEERREFD